MSCKKLPKVCDVRFCANVFRQSVTRRRTSVRKGASVTSCIVYKYHRFRIRDYHV